MRYRGKKLQQHVMLFMFLALVILLAVVTGPFSLVSITFAFSSHAAAGKLLILIMTGFVVGMAFLAQKWVRNFRRSSKKSAPTPESEVDAEISDPSEPTLSSSQSNESDVMPDADAALLKKLPGETVDQLSAGHTIEPAENLAVSPQPTQEEIDYPKKQQREFSGKRKSYKFPEETETTDPFKSINHKGYNQTFALPDAYTTVKNESESSTVSDPTETYTHFENEFPDSEHNITVDSTTHTTLDPIKEEESVASSLSVQALQPIPPNHLTPMAVTLDNKMQEYTNDADLKRAKQQSPIIQSLVLKQLSMTTGTERDKAYHIVIDAFTRFSMKGYPDVEAIDTDEHQTAIQLLISQQYAHTNFSQHDELEELIKKTKNKLNKRSDKLERKIAEQESNIKNAAEEPTDNPQKKLSFKKFKRGLRKLKLLSRKTSEEKHEKTKRDLQIVLNQLVVLNALGNTINLSTNESVLSVTSLNAADNDTVIFGTASSSSNSDHSANSAQRNVNSKQVSFSEVTRTKSSSASSSDEPIQVPNSSQEFEHSSLHSSSATHSTKTQSTRTRHRR